MRDARQEKHRHKHDADANGRDQGRDGDLLRGVEDGLFSSFPVLSCRSMFSISTVASSTRMPTARARPPSVMMLMVSPSALKRSMEVRRERGIETQIISVLRQLPRKTRISPAAMRPSRSTPWRNA